MQSIQEIRKQFLTIGFLPENEINDFINKTNKSLLLKALGLKETTKDNNKIIHYIKRHAENVSFLF